MKKLVILAAAVLLIFTACKEKKTSVKMEGIINFIAGDVLIASESGEVKAKIGDFVSEGFTIKTGAKSAVDIHFSGSVIRILEKSTVTIRELIKEVEGNKEFTELYVEEGKVFSQVARKLKGGEKYQVTTKTVVAGVRGTEFLVEDYEGASRISCIEGTVAVRKADEDESRFVNLEAGNEAVIDEDKKLNVRELKEQNRENIRKIRDEIKEMRKDIRDKFEAQRAEIRKQVSDLKESTKEKVAEQKAKDRENVQAVKDESKAKAEEIKGGIDEKKDETKKAVQEFQKPDVKGVKPDIKKFGTKDNSTE